MSELPQVNSDLLANITSDVIKSIKQQVADNQISTLDALRDYAYTEYFAYFRKLQSIKPNTEGYTGTGYRDVNVYNYNLGSIANSLSMLASELKTTQDILVFQNSMVNLSTEETLAALAMATSGLNTIEDQVERAQYYSRGKSVITLQDNFDDSSKLDFSRMEVPGHLIKGFGVELPVSSDTNRTSQIIDLQVKNKNTAKSESPVLHPDDKLQTRPAPYEGFRLADPNLARPEGGNWRIESVNTEVATAAPTLKKDHVYVSLAEEVWTGSIMGGVGDAPANVPPGTPEPPAGFKLVEKEVTTYEIREQGSATVVTDGVTALSYGDAAGTVISGWTRADGTTYSVPVDATTSDPEVIYEATPVTATEFVEELKVRDASSYEPSSELDAYRISTDSELFDDKLPESVGFRAGDLSAVGLEESDPFAKTITRNDFLYVESQASEEQMLEYRMRMLDGNPQSFWEIEYTPVVGTVQDRVYAAADSASNDAAKQQAYSNAQSVAAESASELDKTHPDYDSLSCTIYVKFQTDVTTNYLLLDPFLFGDIRKSSFEVTGIRYKSKASGWQVLPGFSKEFSNRITIDSSGSLSDKHLSRIGTNNKFAYRGKGIWTLPPDTLIHEVEIDLFQDVAIPNPFPLQNIQLLKKVTKSISESQSSSSGSVGGFKTDSQSTSGSATHLERGRLTEWIEFGYLETLIQSLTDGANTSLLAGTTTGGNVSTSASDGSSNDNTSSTGGVFGILGSMVGTNVAMTKGSYDQAVTVSSAIGGALIAAGGAALDAALSGGSSSSSNSSSNVSFNDSGYQINKEWYRTLWHRVRYAIGIRELSFFAKTFAAAGDIVSRVYEIRNDGKEITLEVSRIIPDAFLNFDPSTNWIEYYIEVDGTQHPIQPIVGESKMFYNGRPVPSSLILSEISSRALAEIRFVAKLKRPQSGQLENAESMTVILENYKVNITDV